MAVIRKINLLDEVIRIWNEISRCVSEEEKIELYKLCIGAHSSSSILILEIPLDVSKDS